MPWLLPLIPAALFFATPLVLAALGELVVERAGVVNIGIEGMMLTGALAAWAVTGYYGPAAGLCAAALAAVTIALPFALATLAFGADQIVTGTGINLLALGVTGLVYRLVPAAVADRVRGIDPRWAVAAAPVIAAATWAYFRFTRSGLELAAIGESPQAADTAGIAVNRRKLAAVCFGAALAGLGGAYLSIMYTRTFAENMTDGRGFLALAIVIFGRWNAIGIVAAALFFGLMQGLANVIATRAGPTFPPATLRLFDMLPYAVSLAALAGVAGKTGAPAALGRPYLRD